MKARVDALESELNKAIIALSGTDFLLGNFDLHALFLESLGKYYSDDVVLWLQDKLTHGKIASFEHMASAVEPIYTFFEMGMASIDIFRVTRVYNGLQGEVIAEWKRCSAGRIQPGLRFAGGPLATGKTGWSLLNASTVCHNAVNRLSGPRNRP